MTQEISKRHPFTISNQQKVKLTRIFVGFIGFLFLGSTAFSQNQTKDNSIASYGAMVAHLGITIAIFQSCINDKRQSYIKNELEAEFLNWKKRHSYADQVRNRMNNLLVEKHGAADAKIILDSMFGLVEERSQEKKLELLKSTTFCPKFLVEVIKGQTDFHTLYRADHKLLMSKIK